MYMVYKLLNKKKKIKLFATQDVAQQFLEGS